MQHNMGYNRAPCKIQEASKGCWGTSRRSKFATWKNKVESTARTFQAEHSLPLKEDRNFPRSVPNSVITKTHHRRACLFCWSSACVPPGGLKSPSGADSLLKRWMKPPQKHISKENVILPKNLLSFLPTSTCCQDPATENPELW